MKDNFSQNSDDYRNFRPNYPGEVFDFIFKNVQNFENAWDVGTGTGQVAVNLAANFEKVFATDISASQIENAEKRDNILYSVQPAENTNFSDDFFDLIIVGQAIHWFDFEKFYTEVKRVGRKSGLIIALGYGRIQADAEINAVIDKFYYEILGKYWDPERKYVDENYKTIPFPFEEISAPDFENVYEWNLHQLVGYLSTWSALKHFQKENDFNPLNSIAEKLEKLIPANEKIKVKFSILFRIGKLE